jgi:hypothetical protein
MRTKKQYGANNIILVIIFLSTVFYAFSSGSTGKTQLNGEGCFCHGAAPTAQVSAIITGSEFLTPNETAEYSVTITGGPLAAAGVNIAASAGTLVPGAGLRLQNGELTHNSPGIASGGIVTFTFSLTAPDTGNIILYAAANSVNNNGAVSGDQWNFSLPKAIEVGPLVGVDDEMIVSTFRLEQNYPNPFNPNTVITYEIPDNASGEFVSLRVYDLLGREAAVLVNETKPSGVYQVNFSASDLSSGVYIYKITAGSYSAVKKMSLLR